MAIRTVNTAVGTATPPPAEKQPDDLNSRLLRYRTSTAVFRSMAENGILTEADYKNVAIFWQRNTAYLCAAYFAEMTCYVCISERYMYYPNLDTRRDTNGANY